MITVWKVSKYGPEKNPYLDTFQAVGVSENSKFKSFDMVVLGNMMNFLEIMINLQLLWSVYWFNIRNLIKTQCCQKPKLYCDSLVSNYYND